MDVDLRKQTGREESEKVSASNIHTDVSFVCIRKPSGNDRARLEDIAGQVPCFLSKIYWLKSQEKENPMTITNDMIHDVAAQLKADLTDIFISTLKCGHYESQLAVFPTIKPAVL